MELFSKKSFSQSIKCSSETVKLINLNSKEHLVSFSYTIPKAICKLTMGQEVLTASAALAVMDEISTYSFAAIDRTCRPGVSVHLTTNMIRPCIAGQEVVIETKINKIGKTLGFCTFEMKAKDKTTGTDTLIAHGTHIKHLPMGLAWDIISSPYIIPIALKLREYFFNKNSKPSALSKKLFSLAFGGLNKGKVESLGVADPIEVGSIYRGLDLQRLEEHYRGVHDIVHHFESKSGMNNLLGRLHGGAVAMSIEEASIRSCKIFQNNLAKKLSSQSAVTVDAVDEDMFLKSIAITYLSGVEGVLNISCTHNMLEHSFDTAATAGLLTASSTASTELLTVVQPVKIDGGVFNVKKGVTSTFPCVQFSCTYSPASLLLVNDNNNPDTKSLL